jgi:hypothetical protein
MKFQDVVSVAIAGPRHQVGFKFEDLLVRFRLGDRMDIRQVGSKLKIEKRFQMRLYSFHTRTTASNALR